MLRIPVEPDRLQALPAARHGRILDPQINSHSLPRVAVAKEIRRRAVGVAREHDERFVSQVGELSFFILPLDLAEMVDRFRAIEHILKQEGASSLGSAGRKLGTAVDMLQRFDRSGGDRHSARRNELLVYAAYLLSAYVIQREAIGLRNHKDLTPEFDLTPEIWGRVGAVR